MITKPDILWKTAFRRLMPEFVQFFRSEERRVGKECA